MTGEDRDKWNARYAAGAYGERTHPSPYLVASLERFAARPGSSAGGRALDLACGRGRNALHLAASGYEVDAVDISGEALARAQAAANLQGLRPHFHELDLDEDDLPRADYDLILVSRYLNRALVPRLVDALAAGGK